MRDYQRLASQYPPLTHEEIIALSRRFVKGRNAQVAFDEHTVVDCVLEGDWSEESLRDNKEAVIAAYNAQINWLSATRLPSDFLYALMPDKDKTVRALYEARFDNMLSDTPWITPMSVVSVCPETEEMAFEDFVGTEASVIDRCLEALEEAIPRHTPKDVVDRWKSQEKEMAKRYLITVRSLEKTPAERRRMRIWIADGERALNDIVNHNLQLAMSRVGKMMENNQRAKTIGVFDLIGAANVGLVLGARQFNPEMGKKFSTYAAFHIDGQLHDLVNREDGKSGILGMTLHEQKQLSSILAIRHTFEEVFNRSATLTELQSLTGISKDIIERRLSTPQVRTQNIYAPVSSNSDDPAPAVLADTLASENDVETVIAREEYHNMIEVLKNEVATLDDDERMVLMSRTGFVLDDLSAEASPAKTARKIAGETGMTIAEINEKYASAIRKLKAKLELHGWSADTLLPPE